MKTKEDIAKIKANRKRLKRFELIDDIKKRLVKK